MSKSLRNVSAREFVKILLSERFELQRSRGSHRIYRHIDGRRVVVAYHHLSDTFPIGTLKGMVSDVGWTEDDLERLELLR